MFTTAGCLLLSDVYYCRMFTTVGRLLLLDVCYCRMFATVGCLLLSDVCYCRMFADEFEKEMEKQNDVLTCDDLSHDMLGVSPDHPFLATTPNNFVVGESEALDVDCFVDQFMQRNLGQN